MYSDKIQKEMFKDLEHIKSVLGISQEKLSSILYDISTEEFSALIEKYHKEVLADFMNPSIDRNITMERFNAIVSLDVNRSYVQATRFVLTEKAFEGKADYSLLHKLEQEDAIFDFKGKEFLFRLSKCRYEMNLGGEFYQVFRGTISTNPANLGEKEETCATLEFDFVVEKLPRIFIYGDSMGACNSCGVCKESRHDIRNYGGTVNISDAQVLCGRKSRDYGKCLCNEDVKTCTGYSIDELLEACTYAVGLFVNRRKRKTDKTLATGVSLKKKIHEPSKNEASVRVLSLKDYNYYERKEKREWQGGHHNSPVQHERKGYFRHYKNGKVVWVNACTVNKGKNKGIYKV